MTVFLFTTPPKKQFAYANLNFLKIFKFEFDQLVKDSDIILTLIYAEDLNYLKSKYSELITNGFINTTEFRLSPSDDKFKHISCYTFLIEDDKFIIGFVKDITRVKQHEDYIVKYTAQKDTLLDMLTHNLGRPLVLTKDLLEFLKIGNNAQKNENAEKLVSLIRPLA